MESSELIHKLIIGSQVIDQMRKEVDSVVKMVIGFLDRYQPSPWSFRDKPAGDWFQKNLVFDDCDWVVRALRDVVPVRDGLKEVVRWSIRYHHKTPSYIVLPYNSDNKTVQPDLAFVSRVHQNLPLLIEGLREFFHIAKEWQPLLDAADYAEKNSWRP